MDSRKLPEKIDENLAMVLIIIAIIIIVSALVAGLGLITSILLAGVIVVGLIFNGFSELIGSVICGVLLKVFSYEIANILGIWWTSGSHQRFVDQITTRSVFQLIAVFFFVSYSLSFLTGRIKLIHITSKTE